MSDSKLNVENPENQEDLKKVENPKNQEDLKKVEKKGRKSDLSSSWADADPESEVRVSESVEENGRRPVRNRRNRPERDEEKAARAEEKAARAARAEGDEEKAVVGDDVDSVDDGEVKSEEDDNAGGPDVDGGVDGGVDGDGDGEKPRKKKNLKKKNPKKSAKKKTTPLSKELDFTPVVGLADIFRSNRRVVKTPDPSEPMGPQKIGALRQLHLLVAEARKKADAGEGIFEGEIFFPGRINPEKEQLVLAFLKESIPEVADNLSIGDPGKRRGWVIQLQF